MVPVSPAVRFSRFLVPSGPGLGPGCTDPLTWPKRLFLSDFDTLLGGEVGGVEFGKLPFGACEEPIRWVWCSRTVKVLWAAGTFMVLSPSVNSTWPRLGLASQKESLWTTTCTGRSVSVPLQSRTGPSDTPALPLWPRSDLDPLQAPHWSVRVRTAENPQCLLGEMDLLFTTFTVLIHSNGTQ